ncbi:ATP-binding cassette domain-containing protein [Phycisphaeraceae bacterium D3-23]
MIEVKGLAISLPGFALKDIALAVPDNAYAILMGKTGCGKTTLLEAVCGLRKVGAGTITLHGRDITRAKPGERGIGYVPQDGALFPTMTVNDQLAFAMQLRKWDKQKQKQRIDELAELLGIAHLLKRKPRGLSGGERQRVALGRALAFRPEVLCLDEPLSALDEDTRGRMIDLLKRVQQHEHVTALHITHSSSEARQLGTHVLRLVEGKVEFFNHEGAKGTKEGK